MTRGVVVGHGIDIVEISDFRRLLDDHARSFVDRHFTEAELGDAGDGVAKVERLAGRFAAKEAVMKALGVGWGDGIAFTDIEVETLSSGAPEIVLHRKLASIAAERGISSWLVTTSHSRLVAVASAIALEQPG